MQYPHHKEVTIQKSPQVEKCHVEKFLSRKDLQKKIKNTKHKPEDKITNNTKEKQNIYKTTRESLST